MNGKIVLSVLIAFIVTFGLLFTIQFMPKDSNNEIEKDSFFSQKFVPETNIAFLLGSSQIGHLNTTYIIDTITNDFDDYDLFNLAVNSDDPKERAESIDKIISLHPKIVFYGISYRDFETESSFDEKSILPDFRILVEDNIPNELESINPQLITRRAIRDILNDTSIVMVPVYDIHPPNTPFFSLGNLQTKIIDDDELQRQTLIILPSPKDLYIAPSNNEQVRFFKQIIRELQENKIKVVIFTTPLHKIYLNELNQESKDTFNKILNEILNEFDVKIYNFIDKYSDLPVWNNLDHLAYNENSMMFSEDIAEMILLEINS